MDIILLVARDTGNIDKQRDNSFLNPSFRFPRHFVVTPSSGLILIANENEIERLYL